MSGLENIKNENVDLVFYSFLSSGLINCYHAHKLLDDFIKREYRSVLLSFCMIVLTVKMFLSRLIPNEN